MLKKQPEELKKVWSRSIIKTSALHFIHSWTQGRILASLIFLIGFPPHWFLLLGELAFCCWRCFISFWFPLPSFLYCTRVLFYCYHSGFLLWVNNIHPLPQYGIINLTQKLPASFSRLGNFSGHFWCPFSHIVWLVLKPWVSTDTYKKEAKMGATYCAGGLYSHSNPLWQNNENNDSPLLSTNCAWLSSAHLFGYLLS